MGRDRLNVLSIDWDYFIDASINTRSMYFPDGHDDFSQMLQTIIWSSRYCQQGLSDVNIDYESVKQVYDYLDSVSYWENCMVVDSHKYAYDFILDNYDPIQYDGVNIVNIDFHHDIYKNGTEVDCGNWLRKLMNESIFKDNSQYIWVSREDSDISDESDTLLERVTDLDIIGEYDWDIIFICRSAMWSPPHLDKYFKQAFECVLDKGLPVVYERDIFKDRYDDTMKKSIADSADMLESVYKDLETIKNK